MSADPPPSLLITPDRRRRLQQRYEEAQRLSAQPRADFRRIHDLLAECLTGDPGNALYLGAILANLRRRKAADKAAPWWKRWIAGLRLLAHRKQTDDSNLAERSNDTQYAALSTEYAVLSGAADALWQRPNDAALLRQSAAAAGDCGFDEAELRYLTAARELAPDDADVLRDFARALTRQGRFEEAVGPWFAVAALRPGDAEAELATSDLRGVGGTIEEAADVPRMEPAADAADILIRQAQAKQDAGDFPAAERLLAEAQAAAGGDLRLLEMREGLRLKRSEQRLVIARRRAASDPHPRAAQLVGRLEEEHNRLAIDLLGARVERLPSDWPLRLELARRLKRLGNFSGAIQRLEEAARLNPGEGAVLVELGECWQHLRQFQKASEYYQQAIARSLLDKPGVPSDETLVLARYRAAVLAAAMDNKAFAREQLAAIVAANPAFKDARERLDKLEHS